MSEILQPSVFSLPSDPATMTIDRSLRKPDPGLPDKVIDDIFAGKRAFAWCGSDEETDRGEPEDEFGLLAGSFDPMHDGHRLLRRAAADFLEIPVYFELTVRNADKPALDRQTIQCRFRQLRNDTLLLTSAVTFADKSKLLPNTTFVVGIDTAIRVIAPRFYSDSEQCMFAAFDQLRGDGCRLMVAGRVIDGVYRAAEQFSVPDGYADLFVALPETAFRVDVSSTELRSRDQLMC